jgi:hypothetical protein
MEVFMKKHSIAVYLSAGAVLAILTGGTGSLQAASATSVQNSGDAFAQATPFQTVAWAEAKAEKLRHAYYLLEHANGDYAGHRVVAMRSIKKAAEILGVEIKGGGHAEEAQWASDKQVGEARRLLKELVDTTGGKEQAHVTRAVKELDKALTVK